MRHRIYVVAAVAACLLAAAPAHAGWRHDRALAIADIVWHYPCDHVVVTYETHPDWDAWWAYSNGCDVTLNRRPALRWRWPIYCTVMLHELGHAAGRRHSDNPRSIMSPFLSFLVMNGRVIGADRRCRDRGRPYLERHLDALAARAVRP